MPARAFLAIDLPNAVLDLLCRARAELVRAAPAWASERWVRRDCMHITVKFIGPLPDASLPDACRMLGEVCASFARFELGLSDLVAVPDRRAARMLWVAAPDLPEASALAASVDSALAERFEVPRDERPFKPHVTLARSKRPRRLADAGMEAGRAVLAAAKPAERIVSVPSLTLYSSTLSSAGPCYTVLTRFPLGPVVSDR